MQINLKTQSKMKKAINKAFGYECMYEVNKDANVVIFWVDGEKNIWLGIVDFFKHFTEQPLGRR